MKILELLDNEKERHKCVRITETDKIDAEFAYDLEELTNVFDSLLDLCDEQTRSLVKKKCRLIRPLRVSRQPQRRGLTGWKKSVFW